MYNQIKIVDLAVGGCVKSLLIASIFSVKEGKLPPKNEERQ